MRAYSPDLRVRVREAAGAGGTTAELAERFAVSPARVRRPERRRRAPGAVAPRKAGGPRVPKLRDRLPRTRALLARAPDMTPAELRGESAPAAAPPTPWSAVRSLGLTLEESHTGVTRRAHRPTSSLS